MVELNTALNTCSLAVPNQHGAFTKSPEETTVSHIVERIRSGCWKKEVDEVRSGTRDKRNLPLALLSGTFSGGTKNDDQVSLSGYAAVDFDYKGENMRKDWKWLRKHLSTLPFVSSYFTSARGEGLKALVRLPNNMTVDKAIPHIQKLLSPSGFEIDPSPRAFATSYVSYDPEAMQFREATPIPTQSLEDLPTKLLAKIFRNPVGRLYSLGGGKYFDTGAWAKYTEAQVGRVLRVAGFPVKRKDEVLETIAKERIVDDVVYARSGHYAGHYNEDGHRFLVRTSPLLTKASQGAFPNIERLLKSRLLDPNNPDQYWMFLAWLKRARQRIIAHAHAFRQGGLPEDEISLPGLIIVGVQGIGKSKLFKKIILPLLGGRKVDGKKVFGEATRFNSPILNGEVIVVDDHEATSQFSRKQFAGKLKEFLFSSCVGIEGKFKDESSYARICPIFVQLLNEERIETTPDYYSVWDKVLFLYGNKYMALEEDRNGNFDALNKSIDEELPAFAYYIDNLEVPDSVRPTPGCSTEQRVGMKHYVHPTCRELLEGSDKGIVLLNEFDARAKSGLFTEVYYDKVLSAGRIQELAGNQVKGSPEFIAGLLRTLHERFPDRVTQHRSGKQCRGWIIRPPSGRII